MQRRTLLVLPVAAAALLLPAHHAGAVTRTLDQVVQHNAFSHGIPAQAVVIMRHGRLLYRHAAGRSAVEGGVPVQHDTVFPAYSVSKLMASILLLQLLEEGKVDLAAPAASYLPTLPPAWRAITVEQFLNHVSGVPEFYDPARLTAPFPASVNAVFAQLAGQPLQEAPNTRTRYTGTDFLVIGAILEAVTGMAYPELARQRIISPLGLRHTWLGLEQVPPGRLLTFYHGEQGRLVADSAIAWPAYSVTHGELYTTASDLATFLSAVARGQLVSQSALLRCWHPHIFPTGEAGYFAAGWEYGESGPWHEVGHDGGAKVRGRIVFRETLDDALVIVYLINGSRDNVWSRTLVDSVQQVVLPRREGCCSRAHTSCSSTPFGASIYN